MPEKLPKPDPLSFPLPENFLELVQKHTKDDVLNVVELLKDITGASEEEIEQSLKREFEDLRNFLSEKTDDSIAFITTALKMLVDRPTLRDFYVLNKAFEIYSQLLLRKLEEALRDDEEFRKQFLKKIGVPVEAGKIKLTLNTTEKGSTITIALDEEMVDRLTGKLYSLIQQDRAVTGLLSSILPIIALGSSYGGGEE